MPISSCRSAPLASYRRRPLTGNAFPPLWSAFAAFSQAPIASSSNSPNCTRGEDLRYLGYRRPLPREQQHVAWQQSVGVGSPRCARRLRYPGSRSFLRYLQYLRHPRYRRGQRRVSFPSFRGTRVTIGHPDVRDTRGTGDVLGTGVPCGARDYRGTRSISGYRDGWGNPGIRGTWDDGGVFGNCVVRGNWESAWGRKAGIGQFVQNVRRRSPVGPQAQPRRFTRRRH